MLNISFERINDKIDLNKYRSFQTLSKKTVHGVLIRVSIFILLLTIFSMFLPWTQNIRAKGYVTTLSPSDRPQTVQTLIGGRIEQWYVREGQNVAIGDTIIMISEVKEEYLDPQLLDRTNNQIIAKNESANAYIMKAASLTDQYNALQKSKEIKLDQNMIKLEQIDLKYTSDSMDLVAQNLKLEIAKKQFDRMEKMYSNGLKSLTDLEAKRLSLQESSAKVISIENDLNALKNEKRNLEANISAIENEYGEKTAKSISDKMSALSSKYDAVASANKLQSQYNAYEVRKQNYFITSPISGTITEAIQYGIGEIIKNGESIVSIMPNIYDMAIEMYVKPRDLPLLNKGQKVRVQFDGWPALVFSGWPDNSFGTFGGKIVAIDKIISKNGQFRVLVSEDDTDVPWPDQVQIGGGANTITLLNDVRVGYEIWRQLNGFPPDYYDQEKVENVKSKVPLKKVK